jgi:hypothetical protein
VREHLIRPLDRSDWIEVHLDDLDRVLTPAAGEPRSSKVGATTAERESDFLAGAVGGSNSSTSNVGESGRGRLGQV